MQMVFAPYPMTLKQMGEWAEQVTQLDPSECVVALRRLDHGRTITIKRVC